MSIKPTKVSTPHPWHGLEENSQDLELDAFITVLMSRASKNLRRTITEPYASKYGLSVFEWRTMAVLGRGRILKFSDVVNEVADDKGQVSRVLKQLSDRGLVATTPLGENWRQGMQCSLTHEGEKIYKKIMPEARKAQSDVILSLPKSQRLAFFRILKRLQP